MGKWTKQSLFKGRSPNDQITHEEMLNIPSQKDMQIKTTLRFHLIPVRTVIIKNINNKKMLARM
jgi:hypothetical protein